MQMRIPAEENFISLYTLFFTGISILYLNV